MIEYYHSPLKSCKYVSVILRMIFKLAMFPVRLCSFCPWLFSLSLTMPPSKHQALVILTSLKTPSTFLPRSLCPSYNSTQPHSSIGNSLLRAQLKCHLKETFRWNEWAFPPLSSHWLDYSFPCISLMICGHIFFETLIWVFTACILRMHFLEGRDHVCFANHCVSIALNKVWHIVGV